MERLTELLDGPNDVLLLGSKGVPIAHQWTVDCWFKTPIPKTKTWHTLTRGKGGDHQIIINPDQKSLGTFDNIGGSGFHDTGFDVTSLKDGWHRLTVTSSADDDTVFHIDGAIVGKHGHTSYSDMYAIGNYQKGGQPWGYLARFRLFHEAWPLKKVLAQHAECKARQQGLISKCKKDCAKCKAKVATFNSILKGCTVDGVKQVIGADGCL